MGACTLGWDLRRCPSDSRRGALPPPFRCRSGWACPSAGGSGLACYLSPARAYGKGTRSSHCGFGRVMRSHPRGKGYVPPSTRLRRPGGSIPHGRLPSGKGLPSAFGQRPTPVGLWRVGWGALGSGGHPCRPSSVDLSQVQHGFRGAEPGAFRPLIGILGPADLVQVQHWGGFGWAPPPRLGRFRASIRHTLGSGGLNLGHLGRS